MSPELAQGMAYDETADIYSFAILMWEILTREMPWESLSEPKIFEAVRTGRRPPVPLSTTAPSTFVKVMEQCWAQQPADRLPLQATISTLSQLLADLNEEPKLTVRNQKSTNALLSSKTEITVA